MNDILKKFNSLKIDKPHLNDVLHVFIFNFFKNEEEITILLKNDANQTIFKKFNIFLYKKLIYVLERPNVVKTAGIPVDIICSFFSRALTNSLFYLVQKTTMSKEQKIDYLHILFKKSDMKELGICPHHTLCHSA